MVIGISSRFRAGEEPADEDEITRHIRMLQSAGAHPRHLRIRTESIAAIYAGEIDGLLLSGGADIEPFLYKGNVEMCEPGRDFERDRTEIALLLAGLALQLPILCVCRGLQLANVVMGGTLIEDLPGELGTHYTTKHHQIRELGTPRDEYAHAVTVVPGTKFAGITQEPRFQVNSTHHQAIRTLAPGLIAAAYGDDGIVEAVESRWPQTFFIGVQWHPEALGRADSIAARLFDAFVESADAKTRKWRIPG